jgi:hypothetical protein
MIDTEGYEPHVIASARQLLRSGHVRVVMFEYNLYRAMTPEAGVSMLSFLLSLGYRITVPFNYIYQPASAPAECQRPWPIETRAAAEAFTAMLKDDMWPCAKYAVEMVAFKRQSGLPNWLDDNMLRKAT